MQSTNPREMMKIYYLPETLFAVCIEPLAPADLFAENVSVPVAMSQLNSLPIVWHFVNHRNVCVQCINASVPLIPRPAMVR